MNPSRDMTADDVLWLLGSLMAQMCEQPEEAWENWRGEARCLIRRMCEINGGEWKMDDYGDGLGEALKWWRDQALARGTDFPLGGAN
jgi:hypothetical protein